MALHDILTAIRVVAAGDALIAQRHRGLINEFGHRLPSAPPPQALANITDREREVLTLVGSGHSNTEIAAQLYISCATANTYLTRLLSKLNAHDRVHLVIIAYETGLVAPAQ